MTSGSASGGDSRSVFAAGVSRGPWWVLVHQANSSLEDFEEVRKAWGGLVKKSEAGPTVAEVEKALDLVGEADLQDSQMKMSLVKLILALRTTQEFEIRYRSTAPGRPWVYMTRTLVFPDPETVQAVRDRHEWEGTIHIAATQPTWRATILWASQWLAAEWENCLGYIVRQLLEHSLQA